MATSGAAEHDCVDATVSSSSEARWTLVCVVYGCKLSGTHPDPYAPRFFCSEHFQQTNDEARQVYDKARKNLLMAQQLKAQVYASKGKGKGQLTAERLKSWWDMSDSEKWWLEQLWSGRLHKQLAQAKKKHTTLVQVDRITKQRFQ